MNDKFTLSQFLKRFPNEDKCLEEVKNLRWPDGLIPCDKCGKATKHHKVEGRKAYACQWCGSHIYPLAGTIFDKSTTSLQLWLYAIYLMVQTRAGISAKQLQRELGVTYKTAWRIFHQIRKLMTDMGGGKLDGEVEIDETFVGGKGYNRRTKWHGNEKPKEVVLGMLQRKGKVYLRHIQNTGKWTLLKQVQDNVSPTARVYSDEFAGYYHLPRYGYFHDYVDHQLQYAKGDVHTQNLESFWSTFKRGVTGVYRHVSKKYLQAYADEFGWRYNNRNQNGRMFGLLLAEVANVKLIRASQLGK